VSSKLRFCAEFVRLVKMSGNSGGDDDGSSDEESGGDDDGGNGEEPSNTSLHFEVQLCGVSQCVPVLDSVASSQRSAEVLTPLHEDYTEE
jgi:hypothetical protein